MELPLPRPSLSHRSNRGAGTGPLHDKPSRRYHQRTHARHPRSRLPSANLSISPSRPDPDRILKKMHRIYTIEQYLEKVSLLRAICPQCLPRHRYHRRIPYRNGRGVPDDLRLFKRNRIRTAFLFAYSPRKGTPAMRWKDDIPDDVKEDRLQRLITLQDSITTRHRQDMLGNTYEVLVEKLNFKDSNLLKGRTRCWKNVLFPGDPSLIGTLQNIKIHSYSNHTLLGDRIPS